MEIEKSSQDPKIEPGDQVIELRINHSKYRKVRSPCAMCESSIFPSTYNASGGSGSRTCKSSTRELDSQPKIKCMHVPCETSLGKPSRKVAVVDEDLLLDSIRVQAEKEQVLGVRSQPHLQTL